MEENWLEKGNRAYRKRKYDIAMDCYLKAIAEGDAYAMYLAASMYKLGKGVAKSIYKAKVLLEQAAEAGNEKAARELSWLFNSESKNTILLDCANNTLWRDYVVEARKLWAKGNYKEALNEFLCMADGKVKPDKYSAECMYWIGKMYRLGQGVSKDEEKAEEWLRKAAELGNWKAINVLGLYKKAPEVIWENGCAKATAYIYYNVKVREIDENVFVELARLFKSKIWINFRGGSLDAKDEYTISTIMHWAKKTKLDIYAEGEDAGKAVKSLADLLYKGFSEEYIDELISQGEIRKPLLKDMQRVEFLKRCINEFADIRRKYNLHEDKLKWAQDDPWLQKEATSIIEGCTEQGIIEIEKEWSAWEKKREKWTDGMYGDLINISLFTHVDNHITEKVSSISFYYENICSRLCAKFEQLQSFDDIIRSKELLVSAGDIAAMFYLGKIYEKGKMRRLQDEEKARSYYQLAKETWAGDLANRYTAWLEKTVQDSGLEGIRRLGREYINGTFVEAAKKNTSAKLKHEIKWLNKAINAGDGWAAFTKGNICYYGYGHWGFRKGEAYNNYIKASESKDSIYALELEEMRFHKNKSIDYEILEDFFGACHVCKR